MNGALDTSKHAVPWLAVDSHALRPRSQHFIYQELPGPALAAILGPYGEPLSQTRGMEYFQLAEDCCVTVSEYSRFIYFTVLVTDLNRSHLLSRGGRNRGKILSSRALASTSQASTRTIHFISRSSNWYTMARSLSNEGGSGS